MLTFWIFKICDIYVFWGERVCYLVLVEAQGMGENIEEGDGGHRRESVGEEGRDGGRGRGRCGECLRD
jgi:hypothetical protein